MPDSVNSPLWRAVQLRVLLAGCVIAIAAATTLPACVEVDGGAVELSWRLRDSTGGEDPDMCTVARVGKIRICWIPLEADAGLPSGAPQCTIERLDGGFKELYRDFDCGQRRGVTRFEVPTGPNAFFVQPVCEDGKAPTGPYQVPPPIVRQVDSGAVVTLNQLLVIVTPKGCEGDSCTCPPPPQPAGRTWQSARR